MARTSHGRFRTLLIVSLLWVVILGAALGLALGQTVNTIRTENFTEFTSALPTKLYDIKGRLITEFYAEEKRDPVSIKELPQHLIDAFITREDQAFYSHKGFTIKGLTRAAFGKIIGRDLGGGSTITQQLAGTLYADRRDYTIKRKLVELWWALQLERRYTKDEILEMYLNRMVMGPGVYGVEAASQYFFGHSAKDCTVAEAAILAVQLASPRKYDPYRNPANARSRSREILEQMVSHKLVSREEVDESFNAFWDSFDYTRVSASAFYMREDKAPWFSEYVRRQLEDMLYGSLDLYSDGLSVYTTLDLDQQEAATAYMKSGIERANNSFRRTSTQKFAFADTVYTPIVELLGLTFNISPLLVSSAKNEAQSYSYYKSKINPTLDALALMFGMSDLKSLANAGTARLKTDLEKSVVQGALVTIDNSNGYITALVGGSDYNSDNQLIRATQSKLQPGSTFKPLYYSAAIDSKKITEGTLIYDTPTVFYNPDGTPYMPMNFKGEWTGSLLAWQALAKSMNVPSVKVLQAVGFDAAIERAATLLGITDRNEIKATFPRVYPLALGVIGVSPLQMARAYSVFATGGRSVTPIAIRYVEDRNGNVILNPEMDVLNAQKSMGQKAQIVSPQNAYVMTDMMKRVVWSGTLAGSTQSGAIFKQTGADGKTYTMPMAGKTGTTQNWADAWTLGFSPYFTTAIWLGFDRPGNTLGIEQTGATAAAPIWSNYMRDIHKGLPYKDFPKPQSGIVTATVCAKSGLLPTEYCNEGTVNLVYLDGTQPTTSCNIHVAPGAEAQDLVGKLLGADTSVSIPDLSAPNVEGPKVSPQQQSEPNGGFQNSQNIQNPSSNANSNPSNGLDSTLRVDLPGF